MLQLFAIINKELLLLKRDKSGLLVLFFMPAILVVIITLVQENVMELTGQTKTKILFMDLDEGSLGDILQARLQKGNLDIVTWESPEQSETQLKEAVTRGDYRVGIIVPAGSSQQLEAASSALFTQKNGVLQNPPRTSLPVFFDPGIMAGLRSGITAQLEVALQAVSLQIKLCALEKNLQEAAASNLGPNAGLTAGLLTDMTEKPFLGLKVNGHNETAPKYKPVQQNVPAWTLFGMFFTAIPIAGSVLQEQRTGLLVRQTALPVSPLIPFAGKLITFTGICFCQFFLIYLIGIFLFPVLGLPAFTLSGKFLPILPVIVCCGLAACGYGIFLGMACKNYEKASTIGATSIVAAAALGGVMVPVYAMPQTMQRFSSISPLNWGLSSFHDLLLRGLSFSAILDDLARLLLFFTATAILSWSLARIRL